jgi:hypothetical protein
LIVFKMLEVRYTLTENTEGKYDFLDGLFERLEYLVYLILRMTD